MIIGTVLLFGLMLGLQHALEADHLAAVATLVSRETDRRRVILQGVFWGLGHGLTLLLVAGAVMVVGIALSEAWTHALEAAAGVMLVLLGADLLRRLRRDRIVLDAHLHPRPGALPQVHGACRSHDAACLRHEHHPVQVRAMLIGMIHGLAGSAALALLTLHQVGSPLLGVLYIGLFGIGSVAGMAVLSWAISLPMRLGARHLTGWHRTMNVGLALLSVGLGLHLAASQWPL